MPYPVRYEYDDHGRRTGMFTYQTELGFDSETWPLAADMTGDGTTWVYDPDTGLLVQKLDAAGEGATYTYGPGGRLATRTWARTQSGGAPYTTTYSYDPDTGELLGVDYNDPATADITYSYDRLGRQVQVTDAVGERTFAYDPGSLQLLTETIDGQGAFDGVYDVVLGRKYEDGSGSSVKGRSAGMQLDDGSDYDVTYGYQPNGRFDMGT